MHARKLALTLLVFTACAPDGAIVEGAPGELVVCAGGPTVEGIDVSSWQGGIDWGAVAASGIQFAIVRIGDGNYRDPDFRANWDGARNAGLIRGAYQYFEPGDDPVAQANIVVDAVGVLGAGDLPVTIDVEAPNPSVSPGDYAARIHAWADRVAAGTGRPPIIYTGRYYWDPYVASSDFTNLPRSTRARRARTSTIAGATGPSGSTRRAALSPASAATSIATGSTATTRRCSGSRTWRSARHTARAA